jgi:regulator of RNase E activity RraA
MDFTSETEFFDYMEHHFYSAALSDIMDEMGIEHQAIDPAIGIIPLRADFVTVGRAYTFLNAKDTRKEDPYELAIKGVDQLGENSLAAITSVEPLNVGIMGELTATAMRKRKSRGAVVDGFTRDGRKLLSMSFPTFAKGVSPIDTTGRVRVVDIGCTITIGGVKIEPGTIIFADYDGIMVIPKEHEKEIIEKTIERVNEENLVRNHLQAGGTMAEAWDKYHVL